jgi:RimJ/RimL family protein N-acetyltransferase
MRLSEFVDYHRPALEAREVEYNLILGLLENGIAAKLRLWSLGDPGSCAIQFANRAIVLGALSEPQCHQLARETRRLNFSGIVGCRDTAKWFADQAAILGISFIDVVPQQINILTDAPQYPGVGGHARPVCQADADQLVEWVRAFFDEAVRHDPRPTRERLQGGITAGHFFFWIVNEQPVSMAAISRRTTNLAAISNVYTPPNLRGRGYAGSVTAAVSERIFREGKNAVCIYTDMRNAISNHCYTKIGFKPVCPSYHYVRRSLGWC